MCSVKTLWYLVLIWTVDNKKKDILILGKDPTQGLDDTTLTAERGYSINFAEHSKKMLTFDDFKNNHKSVWSNVFWYVKVCIFWKFIHYAMHWDKTQMLKEFSSDKKNGTKDALSFLLQAPTHYMSWSARFVSLKLYVRFSISDFVSFLLKFIF